MRRFISAVVLCIALLVLGLFFFRPATRAEGNPLANLLEMPAPPPPNPGFRITAGERDEKFFDKKNPPNDDAPTDDLLTYWKYQNQFDPKFAYAIKPSEKTVGRLMDEIEKKPEMLSELLGVMPEGKDTAEFVKRLYDDEVSKRSFDPSWRSETKKWLTYHSPYFSDELAQMAEQAADTKEYVTNQDEVLALARVDWERARPLLDRMLGNSDQPIAQTLARWAYYQHALAVNDSLDIDKYRKELQETVENKNLQPGNRDLAMDALVESGDFPGRDDWYYSLLEDETLYELKVNGQVYTGLTTMLNHSPPDKYVEKMIELAGSSNPTVRNAAVKNLSALIDNIKTPEIVTALLPWLEDPKWAKDTSGTRSKLVYALRNFAIPESVPGLIAMLNEKEYVEVETTANANVAVNRPPTNTGGTVNPVSKTQITYPYRSAAIMALEKQRSPLAVGPLRQLLSVVEEWERPGLVRTLLVSNGFSIPEQIDGLEEAAKAMAQTEQNANSANAVSETSVDVASNPQLSLRMLIGTQLTTIEDVSEELVAATINRISLLDKRNPAAAAALRQIVQNWKGAAINSLLLRDLKNGKGTAEGIVKLLIIRKELREKQFNEITDASGGSPLGLGITACLLEDVNGYDALLDGDNVEAKTALLGCARLIRAPLPLQKVAVNLQSPNKLLALAAERYLETEDSAEARRLVLARHPNEARILGARVSFMSDENVTTDFSTLARDLFTSVNEAFLALPAYYFYSYSANDFLAAERKLQKEVKENQDLIGIYAYNNNFVRIYRDRTVFSWQDDPARYRERVLDPAEFEGFKNFLIAQRVDELPPFLSGCQSCEEKELVMVGRNGGRRVFLKADAPPPFFVELENIFAEFRRQPAQIHYYLEKDVPGLEVLFADENYKAATVWKNGDDFRLLIDDASLRKKAEKEAEEKQVEPTDNVDETELTEAKKAEMEKLARENEKLARQQEYASYVWYRFDRTRLLETTAQPPGIEFVPTFDGLAVQPGEQPWKARAANLEVRADSDGLYKITGGRLAKIRAGYYTDPLVTANGRWAIAVKYTESEEDYGGTLVRVNLLTNKEFKVKIESEYQVPEPVAFLPALNKVLIFNSYGEGEGEGELQPDQRDGQFYLLDADTGIVQPAPGESRPLLQQTFRPLQPRGGVPDEFWAVLPDREKELTRFGVYNARTLVFKPLIVVPRIVFTSMDVWVDEPENKFYFVYEGQLLALPLPKAK
ncbi:MAG: hypothetical protein JSS81_23520 [Acidobacteria bacterium]|nr:hypothetical protein [Acidobacteriota bacterium]